jgi:hypothetical protein
MKKIALVIAMAIASLNSAQAQTQAPSANPARFFLGTGLTWGGDKLATAYYESGGEIDIHAGGLISLSGGLDYQVSPEFSFQASIGYHVANASADNGSVRFERYPLELLAYFHPARNFRIGGGARYLSSPKFKSSGAGDIGDYSFDATVSGVVEAEYLFSEHWGFKARYVHEKLELKDTGEKVDANHLGIFANFYF